MDDTFARVRRGLARPLPLIRYLVLTTETHAFCGSLAFFALLAFYPASSLMLSLLREPRGWAMAHDVLLQALREYYPEGQSFLVRNLEVTVARHGREVLGSILWIVLGAAGVFLPLETSFNRLWGFREHRPYWKNQFVGFLLTAACCLLALAFVLLIASIQWAVDFVVPGTLLADLLRPAALRVAGPCFFIVALFLFYRYLPNGPVRSSDVLPAAVVAGIAAEMARGLYLLVLPLLELQKDQGPYYVSISFVLLVYFESFVVLGGAYLAADAGGTARVSAPPPSPPTTPAVVASLQP
jgi:uncharacterized BrkB/YihY/UPF0761 family membrane protein